MMVQTFPPALPPSGRLDAVALAALIAAAIPAILFLMNVWLFRRPDQIAGRDPGLVSLKRGLPPVSVLIPARNEEQSIAAAIGAVLASRGVELELIVLDDGSTDRTAELVQAASRIDSRVRLEQAPQLPEGWNGKQHACWVLASMARFHVFCFLDADVRLGDQALYRMLSELEDSPGDSGEDKSRSLVSGFPRQQTETLLEWLLLPLIHFVLLGFLPLVGERWSRRPAFAAGCGQFLMVRRGPYFASGGHSAIRTTMHDGLLLPQLLRRRGFGTAVYDLSRDAACRMYRNAGEVWRGLAKNATEGMASSSRIWIFTTLLLLGQTLPLPLAIFAWLKRDRSAFDYATIAFLLGMLIRLVSAWRYRQSWRSVMLHPGGILVMLVLQWYALTVKLLGRPAVWKQREYPAQ